MAIVRVFLDGFLRYLCPRNLTVLRWANERRNMRSCVVSFIDFNGIRHSVEVQAESMYEAAAAALEAFHNHDCPPGAGSELEVQVRSAVTHTIAIKKLKEWASLGGRSPRDKVLKQRIKTVFSAGASTSRT
jgi:hypothetical protein